MTLLCFVVDKQVSQLGQNYFITMSRIATGTVGEQGSVWLHKYLLYFRI